MRAAAVVEPSTVQVGGAAEAGISVRAAAVEPPPLRAADGAAVAAAVAAAVQAGGEAEAGTAVCAAAVEPPPLQAAGGAATAAAVQVGGAAKASAAKWEAFLRPSRALRIGEDLRALRLSAG